MEEGQPVFGSFFSTSFFFSSCVLKAQVELMELVVPEASSFSPLKDMLENAPQPMEITQ